eukprot:TRINITY_DN5258_c0_g1_i1.p1 TRINITY_DN5258_c0_g1~~TRINITY_DN5258_c0_g1_i1.p1  ORF type:complete len:377 (-),score=82.40 TRINITY_DN5258_c0_g1_i1:30-1160(-)
MDPAGNPFPALQSDLFLRAARGERTERVPVWAMRQAGRYLPEYRRYMEDKDFFLVCRTPEYACEITLQPIRRFPLDAAIIFSDILVVPQAMGMEVQMLKGSGPHFPAPLKTPEDIARLKQPHEIDIQAELGYVFNAITLTRHKLEGKVPLIGFSGAPWTLLAYMTEGGGSRLFSVAKTWLFAYPTESHALLQRITAVIIEYMVGQAKAGAQCLQLFESNAGELGPEEFEAFSLQYIQQIVAALKARVPDVPVIVFAKGAHFAIAETARTGCDVVSIDWTTDPRAAREAVASVNARPAGAVTLQGNLEPGVLFAPIEVIRERTRKMLEAFGDGPLIANLGHGMHPSHNPDHLGAFIDAVHEFSEKPTNPLKRKAPGL